MPEILTLNFEQKPRPESASEIGQTGENLAAQYLIRRGLRLVCSNFKVPIGRNLRGAAVTGEIDLIALDADVLCFIEVKTRSSDAMGDPAEAVTAHKRRQIVRSAQFYLKRYGIREKACRFDVVSVRMAPGSEPSIDVIRAAFEEGD